MKKYFSLKRIVFLCIWLVVFFLLPPSMVYLGLIPEQASIIIYPLLLTFLFILLLDKRSFQIGVFLAILLAIFWLYKPPFLSLLIEGLNDRVQDAFFQIRGPKKNTGQIVIVDIDKRSLDTVGQWPWPRSLVGKTVSNLLEDEARVVGFDIVFAEPGRYSLKDLAKDFQDIGFNIVLPNLDKETSHEKINEKEWEITLSGKEVKEIVLKYWEKYFSEEDDEFTIDSDDPSEREKILTEKFIVLNQSLWEKDEKYNSQRASSIGKDYQVRTYIPPENPLIEMGRQATKLYFLDARWDDSEVFQKDVSIIIDNDAFLGESIQNGRVIVGGYFILEQSAGSRLLFSETTEREEETEGMVVHSAIENTEKVFPYLLVAVEQVINVEDMQEEASFQGMFNVIPDKSGAARFYTLLMRAPIFEETLVLKEEHQGKEEVDHLNLDNFETKIISQNITYPSLALQMLRVANGYDNVVAVERPGSQKGLMLERKKGLYELSENGEDPVSKEVFTNVLAKKRFIPLDFKGDMRINYLGYGGKWKEGDLYAPDYYFTYISLSDVLHKRFPKGFFKDKYVILGSTDPTLQDLVGNPFRPAFPGLEVHATMLDNLISEDYLHDLGDLSTLYIYLGLLIGGLLLSLLVAYAGSWLTFVYLLCVLVILPVFSYYAFSQWNTIVEFIYPWVSIILIAIVVILVNFFIEGREKRFLNATFKSYLSPELIDQMVNSGTMPTLGGQESFITAYFTDIAGFSTFSEVLASPSRLVELLNEYLTAMTDILMENGGTLDKYEGDAIIAFFGAPMPLENHAKSSMECAVKMQRKLNELREKWVAEGDKWPSIVHEMRMRIGINSGRIVTGNMGSTQRMNYTMMGDAVNLSARLESGAKQYGVFNMCSEDSIKSAGEGFIVRCIDLIKVMGKNEPVRVYEIIEMEEFRTESISQLVEIFEKAKDKYLHMKWDEAIQLFEKCLEFEPHHPERAPGCKTTPSHVFIDRCKKYKKNPPVPFGEEWDGVYTATEK